MGLSVQVGVLADLLANDPEGAEWMQEELAKANRALEAEGHKAHEEPTTLPELVSRCPINGYPYSFLHFLRRVVAKRLEDPTYIANALPDGVEPDDPAVEEEVGLM